MSDEEVAEEVGAGCGVCMIKPWTNEGCFGTKKYDYGYLCKPSALPWCIKGGVPPPLFFSKDAKLPLTLSLFLGLQHCLAMLAGIATSGGYLITNDTCLPWQKDSQMCGRMPWMISCAWLTSGILTIIQVFRAKVKGTPYFLGTGLISVMGTSFTFLPIARTMTLEAVVEAKGTACAINSAGDPIYTGFCHHNGDAYGAGAIGYGKFLGTALVASLSEVILSFLKPAWINHLFPPVVTGSAVMLIGGGLISSGMKYVGGGVFCGENTESRPVAFPDRKPQLCFNDNGKVAMSFGSAEYVGLAFSCIAFSILIQIFGSPFMKSTFIIWSLAFGCIIASVGKDVDGDGVMDSYYRDDFMEKGKAITFLWAEGTFPLGFSGENFLPILIGFMISSAETIGDVTMTCFYSNVTEEADISSRIQGGLLADGVNSFLACLFGSPPNTTFSQNNGLIALTQCASRSAGFSCGFWLICLGLFGKFGAAFASIPICVVGGVVLQMFSSVLVSGMRIATKDFTRRNQFILMLSLGVGLGVAMEGHIFDWPGPYTFFRRNLAYDHGFWPEKMVCNTPKAPWINADGFCHTSGPFGANNGNCCAAYNAGAKMWRKTVLMILKTPYGIGFIIAFVLNLVIPKDADEMQVDAAASGKAVETSSA